MDKDEVKRLFEYQTLDVLCCFFEESYLETDGPSDFDPINIAKQLRDLGDHYDATVIQPLMHDVQNARTDQVASVFTNSVKFLCKTWVAERPEIVPEKHLLKATMTLSLYMKDNCPDMKELVRGAILNILNNQLGSWIMQQGGWESVSSPI
ncbi:bcl-2-like protein 15 isoform 2-T2 [Clarias gariepinus]|uniref:bcl-2-like protein 15 isoform X2 n=1 Tax=Clarias gariepinus TaxID=13013 RepID=UPI00234DE1EF|nr:bcl-2-like protein 15 isoform X2 [Clarias gariepinus]